MQLPEPRGPLSEYLLEQLGSEPRELDPSPPFADDPLADDDLQLALYVAYELHYRGFSDADERWEWEPSLIALRRSLERQFEAALEEELGPRYAPPSGAVADALQELVAADDGPSLSRYLEARGTLEEFREFAVHRSAYQLKEADPHSWAIPRLAGPAKAALVEIQSDEYGSGAPQRVHAFLFAETLEALGLEPSYGAYLDSIPGVTLATVNLMSLLGLQRRHRGAIVGHLAAFEMTSSQPNRRYGNALRRLGRPEATGFYDEHVEADSVHENVAVYDLAGSLARDEPSLAGDILFGARALLELENRFAAHLLDRWAGGESSLRKPLGAALPA